MLKTTDKILDPSQRDWFENFGEKITAPGVNFAVCNVESQQVLFCSSGKFNSDKERLEKYSRQALKKDKVEKAGQAGSEILRFGRGNQVLAVVLKTSGGKPEFVALIDVGEALHSRADTAQPMMHNEVFASMLELFSENYRDRAKAEEQLLMFSSELSEVYEELVLLHKLSTNMKINESDVNYLQMACDSLTDIVLVEGIAILLKKNVEKEKKLTLVAGSGLMDIDDRMSSVLYSRLMKELNEGKEVLLDSEVDSAFKYDWPENIKSIVAVPLCGKEKAVATVDGKINQDENVMGLMVAINRINKQDFDCPDAKLFNSVANGCAVFVENGRLFGDLKELFIGSLKAMTSSIDAKDEYTRGHSERVACISRWIAQRLEGRLRLSDERIHKVYLTGLLHDIGKLGVAEAVLRKKGKLTRQEFDCIKMHPSIGAGILDGIKQMRDIVPGVLCHHERIDGKGYPNGWAGDKIPLTGRIIAVADSFDAMTSRRTYRDAMTLEEALEEIKRCLGTQFDEDVGGAFVNSDVERLWNLLQDGTDDNYGTSDFSKYGTEVVGTLIR